MHKTRWLGHVNYLTKKAMEKGVADINLFYWPSGRDNKGENGSDCNGFDNRVVGFTIINSFLLMEAFGNKAGLITINTAIRLSLDAINSFRADNVHGGCRRNNVPSTILQKSMELFSHGISPYNMLDSKGVACGLSFRIGGGDSKGLR
jgi:hypothetical protein